MGNRSFGGCGPVYGAGNASASLSPQDGRGLQSTGVTRTSTTPDRSIPKASAAA